MPFHRYFRLREIQPINSQLYTSLNLRNEEIRLLKVVPSKVAEEPLECILETVSLDDNPQFVALSYVWGDPTITTSIYVNGVEKAVTVNLASVLREIRTRRHLPRSKCGFRRHLEYVWADAICIDQNNTRERTHQLNLMRRIYREAELVISWLHDTWDLDQEQSGQERIALAIKVFEALYSDRNLRRNISKKELSEELDFKWMRGQSWLHQKDSDELPAENIAWNAVSSFSRHPYFFRLWILQEMALARRQVFWTTNGIQVDSPKVWFYVHWLGRDRNPQRIYEWLGWGLNILLKQGIKKGMCASLIFIEAMRLSEPYKQSQVSDFLDESTTLAMKRLFHTSVMRAYHWHAAEPRDRLFVLSSLPGALVPDYESTVRDVYCKFWEEYKHVLEKNLEFLVESGTGHHHPNLYDLPSWTMDLSITNGRYWRHNIYFADQDITGSTSIITAEKRLKASGCQCDSIVQVEPAFSQDNPAELLSFVKNYGWKSEDSSQPYPTGITKKQALVRTLVFDYDARSHCRLNIISPLDRCYLSGCLGSVGLETDLMELYQSERPVKEVFPGAGQPMSLLLQDLFPAQNTADEDNYSSDFILNQLTDSSLRGFLGCNLLETHSISGKRLFLTENGYIGVGPIGTQDNDIVCVLEGCPMPVLLRKHSSWYEHVGACFVLGFMYGEAAEQIREGKLKEEEFEIR